MANNTMSPADINNMMARLMSGQMKQIGSVLPRHLTPERMCRIVVAEALRKPDIAECTPSSIVQAVMDASTLGLEPSGPLGHFYLVARWNGKLRAKECIGQIGYKGYLQLALRSGEVAGADARVVYDGDEFDFTYGFNADLRHRPGAGPFTEDNITHAYCWIRLNSGAVVFEVLNREQILAKRDQSDSWKKNPQWSPWSSHFDRMARKAAVRTLFNGGMVPLSAEIRGKLVEMEQAEDGVWRDADATRSASTLPSGRSALGLPDHGEQPDPLAGIDPRDEDRGEVIPVEPEQQPEAQAEQSATPSAREQLLISITELEDALLEAKGSDAVDAAQKAAKVDGKKLDDLTDQQIKGYRLELRTRA